MNVSASTPIYSITPFTLLDYPHQSACILWFAGCNMRCLYCYNPEIVLGKGKLTFQDALDFLHTRKNLLDAVVFSGGECLLHKNCLEFIATVKKSVEDNMDNPSFNVDVLCNLLNMSRTSFYNKIKALTDQAPADYIRLIRLKHAAQLLKEQKHTITEISELTGFSDAKYFREVFKKHFNMSPSQYAKRGKEGKDDKEIK